MTTSARGHEVLIIDRDADARRRWHALMGKACIEAVFASSADDLDRLLETARPSVIVVDMPRRLDLDPMLRAIAADSRLTGVPVLVLTEDDSMIEAAYEAGADDIVRKPVMETELLARVRSYGRMWVAASDTARKEQDAHVMLELTQALASSLDFREILFTVVRRIAEVLNVARASIVLAPEPEHEDIGYVVVASDDAKLSNLRIDLTKYPEIKEVLRTGHSLTISDVATHPVLDGVRDSVPAADVGSMTLFPINWQDQSLGVLFLRASAKRGQLTERDVGFCRIVANATAVALRNARVMQSLRDHTQQVTFARFEAERRLRSLKRYADLFDSLSDGIAVVDADGHLLFANPRAFEVLTLDSEKFRGRKLREIIHPDDAFKARELWSGFGRGVFPRDVDLKLVRSDGSHIIASVATSSLLHGEGAILFTFRDVTESRRMESELVRTKEFLESLIQASVDGIVASDLKGTIILFNEGAERIYGYRSDEVLGRLNARKLYPDGVAEQVMRMLRGPAHGGPGRLESTRLEAMDKDGETISISLSAAMIYQDKEPVATFGIFTDLRDRIRVEERLAQAQQKLALTEKQALIAELAGTAAHELNQPLTSVMGYAELLKRKLGRDSAEHHAADIIVREAERMADIVRKIGKITKYETKSYVGQQRILDLDKASEDIDNPGKP
jgi:PAS domain S-box-containing protein